MEDARERERRAAVAVQAAGKGWLARRDLARQARAAVLVQRLAKGFLARRRYARDKQRRAEDAALDERQRKREARIARLQQELAEVKAQPASKLHQWEETKMRLAAVKVQARWRAIVARRDAEPRRREAAARLFKAAVTVQKAWRALVSRREYQRRRMLSSSVGSLPLDALRAAADAKAEAREAAARKPKAPPPELRQSVHRLSVAAVRDHVESRVTAHQFQWEHHGEPSEKEIRATRDKAEALLDWYHKSRPAFQNAAMGRQMVRENIAYLTQREKYWANVPLAELPKDDAFREFPKPPKTDGRYAAAKTAHEEALEQHSARKWWKPLRRKFDKEIENALQRLRTKEHGSGAGRALVEDEPGTSSEAVLAAAAKRREEEAAEPYAPAAAEPARPSQHAPAPSIAATVPKDEPLSLRLDLATPERAQQSTRYSAAEEASSPSTTRVEPRSTRAGGDSVSLLASPVASEKTQGRAYGLLGGELDSGRAATAVASPVAAGREDSGGYGLLDGELASPVASERKGGGGYGLLGGELEGERPAAAPQQLERSPEVTSATKREASRNRTDDDPLVLTAKRETSRRAL